MAFNLFFSHSGEDLTVIPEMVIPQYLGTNFESQTLKFFYQP